MSVNATIATANEESGRSKAVALRAEHGLGIAPISDVASFAEEVMGFDIVLMDMLNPDDEAPASRQSRTRIDAMTARDPDRDRTLIAVATTKNAERQRFSIAHELGHALFNDLLDGDEHHPYDSLEEDRAHCFARHLLIPVGGIAHRLDEYGAEPGGLRQDHLSTLVQHFGVSAVVAARQLHFAGWITDAQFAEWSKVDAAHLATIYGWQAERVARVVSSQTPRMPQRLVARATRAYTAGLISLEALAAVRGETLDDTREWVTSAGVTVKSRQPEPLRRVESAEI